MKGWVAYAAIVLVVATYFSWVLAIRATSVPEGGYIGVPLSVGNYSPQQTIDGGDTYGIVELER